jgi:hypothetical protein
MRLADEAVAHARQSLDIPRRAADVVERNAQLAYRDIEPVVEVDHTLRP